MSIKHTTTVDIGDLRKLSKPIHLMQYDKSLPEIEVHITKDGQEYTIPSGYSATIRWVKPDRHGCTAAGTVSGSTVTFKVTEQMACVAGRSKVTVEIVESDSSQAGTAIFEVIVDSNPIGDYTIVSDSEIADIQKAIEAGQKAIEAGQNAVTASETATAKANEASTSATTASQKAEEAIASAQTAAEKAKEAKASADSIANVTSDVDKLKNDIGGKVDKPSADDEGKIARAKAGGVEWAEVGQPTDVQTENAVTKWLDSHPEATTTVQNNSISIDKMVLGTLEYVTPKMFGAVGDGIADDSDAFFEALNYCNTNKKTLVINDMTLNLQTIPKLAENKDAIFVISCNIKSRQSKIIMKINSSDTINSAFLIKGNDIDIDGISIENQSEAKNRYFLISFKKCKNVNFNKCYISDEVQRDTNLSNMVTGFIDISEQNNNLKLINSVLINKNSISGGIWIRESTKGAITKNITIKDCIIHHSCCDESLAIWGFNGKVENILIENNLFIEEKRKQNGGIAIFTLHQTGSSDNIIFANNEIIIEDECEFIYIFLQRFSENAGITKILNNTINIKLNSKMKSSYGLFNAFDSFNDIIKDNIILLQNGTNQTDKCLIFRNCKNVINNKIIGKELNNTNVVISQDSYLSNNNIDMSCPIAFYGTKIPLLENNIITAPSAINNYLFSSVYDGTDNFNFIIRGNYIDLNTETKLNINCNNKSNLFIINNYFPKLIVQSDNIQDTYIACNNILKGFSVTTPTVNSNNSLIT